MTTDELAEMLKAIAQVTDEEKVQKICTVMDEDRDGNISLDELTKVLKSMVAMVTMSLMIRLWNSSVWKLLA